MRIQFHCDSFVRTNISVCLRKHSLKVLLIKSIVCSFILSLFGLLLHHVIIIPKIFGI